MTGFSRAQTKIDAVTIKIRQNKLKAKGQHPDMKLKHPDWCRDANKGDYTMLIKHTTEQCQKAQKRQEAFTKRLHEH